MQLQRWNLIAICFISTQIASSTAFSRGRLPTSTKLRTLCRAQLDPERDIIAEQNSGESGEETLSEADSRLSDILPPTLSFARNSILFSENPVTQRNNEVLTFWRGMKSIVPPIITGAWPWRDPYLADENPLSAFYNICFIRMPTIFMGLVYANNLKEGHPLILDYGDGPMEVSPFIVFGVLAIVLA